MSEFEHELMELLEHNGTSDTVRESVLRLQIGSEFERKKKRLLILTWVFHAVYAAFLVPGLFLVFSSRDTRSMIQGLALVVLGNAGLVIIKLWYWIVHARLEIVREIKRLELRLSARRPPPGDEEPG